MVTANGAAKDLPDDLERRAARHRALGDPLRLAIVDALVLGDLTPSEVEARFDVPSNLLAHHLGILEDAGLVHRSRSQGDGRRRYLSLERGVPGLLGPHEPPLRAERVVFVCTRNSARSPLASALWRQLRPDIPATSAGTHPAEAVHPLATEAGRRAGLAIEHRPQALQGFTRDGDLVITVCDQAHEESPGTLHWSIPDPVREARPEAFARTVDQLRDRIEQLAEHTQPADYQARTS
ncbi:MAG: helix-turn-helix domain-containing protein [Dehalococcoidia bacterium]|nr:helix-turn-helix domain-containing protein [Dehalococcoidia bacterium]